MQAIGHMIMLGILQHGDNDNSHVALVLWRRTVYKELCSEPLFLRFLLSAYGLAV